MLTTFSVVTAFEVPLATTFPSASKYWTVRTYVPPFDTSIELSLDFATVSNAVLFSVGFACVQHHPFAAFAQWALSNWMLSASLIKYASVANSTSGCDHFALIMLFSTEAVTSIFGVSSSSAFAVVL